MTEDAGAPVRDPRRMVAFADAVVAIALTLLVLPLVDLAGQWEGDTPIITVLAHHQALLSSFLLTFALVTRLWWVHYQLFERAVTYDGWVLAATLGWLLAVVVLPFGARLIATRAEDRGAISIYVGTLLFASICLAVLAQRLARRPGLRAAGHTLPTTYRIGPVASSLCLAAVLMVGLVVPRFWYWSMTSLLLPSVLTRASTRASTHAPTHAHTHRTGDPGDRSPKTPREERPCPP